MRGYRQFSFWIPITLAKIFFSRIIINRAKIPLNKKATSLTRDAHNVCAVAKRGTVLKCNPIVLYMDPMSVERGYTSIAFGKHLAPVVQRADNFIHSISSYPAEQMYSNTTPFLNLTHASTLFINYRFIEKILHTFYLPDSELSSG